MAMLKEDGSLNIEWITQLPTKERHRVMARLTPKQFKEYASSLPLNESKQQTKLIIGRSLEDALSEGAILADDAINKWRKILNNKNDA